MKIFKRIVPISLTAIMLASVFTGCGSKEEKVTEMKKVRLNEVVHSVFYAPQYVALEQGFFKDEGLEIELSVGQGADKSMTAIVSNTADIALLGTEAGIYVYNQGKENYAVSFAQLTQRAGNFLVSRQKEDNFKWEDLKGKSVIGGRIGGMPELVLEYILKEHGHKLPGDVEIINNIAFTSTAGAFLGNVGDYTVEFEPSATSLESTGSGHIVASLGEASGFVPYTVYMATKSFIEQNPETVQSFTNAIYRGQLWVDSHTSEEIATVIHPHFKEFDIPSLTKIIERYKKQDTWKKDPVFEEESLRLIEKILDEGNELDKPVPYEDFINNTFANEAIKTVKK